MSRPSLSFRTASGAMALLFAGAAAVQWNDPDAIGWIAVYGLAGALAGLGAAGRVPFTANLTALAVFVGLAAVWLPGALDGRMEAFQSFEMRAAEDEWPREAAGLALCAIWSAVLCREAWRGRWDR